MGKKKKKKKISEEAVKIESKKISISKKIDDILKIRWIPVIIFLLLSVIYFNKLIFQQVVLVSTEGGPVSYGRGGGSIEYFNNPFKEQMVWENMLMGGHLNGIKVKEVHGEKQCTEWKCHIWKMEVNLNGY